jgi:hypothetical protein
LVLGIDPLAGKGCGVIREYSDRDAAKLIYFGNLIDLGWNFKAALDYLNGCVPSMPPEQVQKKAPQT